MLLKWSYCAAAAAFAFGLADGCRLNEAGTIVQGEMKEGTGGGVG